MMYCLFHATRNNVGLVTVRFHSQECFTLRCLIKGGVGISGGGGGLEKSPKHNKRVGWNSQGGLEMMQQFSHVFFFVSIETKITKHECTMLCSQ